MVPSPVATSASRPGGREIKSQTIPSPERSAIWHVTLDMQGDGRIDPRMPDKLSGSTRETEGRTTHTLTWDLQRN